MSLGWHCYWPRYAVFIQHGNLWDFQSSKSKWLSPVQGDRILLTIILASLTRFWLTFRFAWLHCAHCTPSSESPSLRLINSSWANANSLRFLQRLGGIAHLQCELSIVQVMIKCFLHKKSNTVRSMKGRLSLPKWPWRNGPCPMTFLAFGISWRAKKWSED